MHVRSLFRDVIPSHGTNFVNGTRGEKVCQKENEKLCQRQEKRKVFAKLCQTRNCKKTKKKALATTEPATKVKMGAALLRLVSIAAFSIDGVAQLKVVEQ